MPICSPGVARASPCDPALGHPQKAFVIEEEAVRKTEEAGPEAVDEVALQVELHDRVQVGSGALVGAATVEDPEVLAVRVGKDAADGAHHAPFGQLLPAEGRPVRVGGRRLGQDVRTCPHHQPRQHDQRCRDAANRNTSACIQHGLPPYLLRFGGTTRPALQAILASSAGQRFQAANVRVRLKSDTIVERCGIPDSPLPPPAGGPRSPPTTCRPTDPTALRHPAQPPIVTPQTLSEITGPRVRLRAGRAAGRRPDPTARRRARRGAHRHRRPRAGRGCPSGAGDPRRDLAGPTPPAVTPTRGTRTTHRSTRTSAARAACSPTRRGASGSRRSGPGPIPGGTTTTPGARRTCTSRSSVAAS